MKLFRSTMIVMLAVLALTIAACSSSKAPVEPGDNTPLAFGVPMDGGNVLAVYDAVIDPVAGTFEVTPVERIGAYHFPVSQYFPSVLKIVGYGFTPNFWADIKISHPYPGSGINGYDVRVIGIVPANTGVSFNYPTFNAIANNKVVMEPDGYTKLFDNFGGSIAGNTNPFKAYFKSQPYRVCSSTGVTSETQRWNLNLSGFGGPLSYKLVVDVSTNYPAAPQPIVDNAPEPVELTPTIGAGLTPTGGSATVNVTLLDWQGPSIGIGCAIEGPALFNSTVTLAYSGPGPNPNEYIYSGNITNSKGAPAGDYMCLIGAWDTAKSIYIYEEVKATVSGGGGGGWILDPNRTNVDMSGFDFPPDPGSDIAVVNAGDMEIDGIRMYAMGGYEVKIDFDLTNDVDWGYGFLPWDDNPSDPHPNPDEVMKCVRIDSANNGATFRTFDDPHKGLNDPGPPQSYQRNDCIILMETYVAGYMEPLTGVYVRFTADNTETPYDERTERFRGNEVWEEADTGNFLFVNGIQWSGTIILDDSNTWPRFTIFGGYEDPYFTTPPATFYPNWGLWSVNGLPANQVAAVDASQQDNYLYQYIGFSGENIGNVIGCYDKSNDDWVYLDEYYPTSTTANILDIQLIPLQKPALVINDIHQTMDWIAVLLDDNTVEIIDPAVTGGQSVTVLNVGTLDGDVAYLDVDNSNASIYITHTDGTVPYCSVLVLD